MSASPTSPTAILETAFSFWSSEVPLTAVGFGLFTKLGDRRHPGAEPGREPDLHPRAIPDFLDALVAMKRLDREGDGPDGRYVDTPEGKLYLDAGRPQNEVKHGAKGIFEELCADLPKPERFLGAMTGLSRINFEAFADEFDFSPYKTLCDVGGQSDCSASRLR